MVLTATLVWLALFSTILLGGVAFAAILLRLRSYRRFLNYDPRHDYLPLEVSVDLRASQASVARDGFVLSQETCDVVSAFVELYIETTFLGRIFDPYIEVTAGSASSRQYFERGAKGRRYLNISRY